METDRNLLFGVLALQTDFIDAAKFAEACVLWATRKTASLADVLIERGWIAPADRDHIEYLVARRLGTHDSASSSASSDDGERTVAEALPESTVEPTPPPVERYSRVRLHATGGIGRVWLAHDSDLGRNVALKELRPEQAGHAAHAARFLQEARITGQLEHPGIVPVYELVRHDSEQPFYTMRFVKGRTLSEAAQAYHEARRAGRAESLHLLALLNAFVTVCNTVAYAHSHGVIHRDLKGQNVILGDFGEVVVLDWGLAKRVDAPQGEPQAPTVAAIDVDSAGSGYTVQGQAMGTPAYMAPEQAAGRLDLIGRCTDVYGLGAMLYEILTGQPPFRADDTHELLRKVRDEMPAPPRQICPEVPPALEALCLRALAKDPADRPAAAADVAMAVQSWQELERRKAEQALRESEALYHSLVESLPCCVVRKDLDGRFIFANQRFCEMEHKPIEQFLGKTDFDLWPPNLAAKYRRDDQHVLETGGVFEDVEEHHTATAHGKQYVHTLKTVVRDAAGRVSGTQSIFWDVTARMRAEEELRKSRERFELAVLGSQDGLWDWDLEANQVWYSPQLRNMLGYNEQEFPNEPDQTENRVHPDDYARWRAALYGHVMGLTDHLELEYRVRHKDGSYRWVRDRGVALRDAEGKAVRMAGSREDITERKQSEADLAYERYLLDSLMDTIPDLIYFKDRDGRYIRINASLAVMFGVKDPAEVRGKTVRDLVTDEYAAHAEAEDREIFRTGEPVVAQDVRVTWADGRSTWVSTTKMPLRDPHGEIIGTFGIARDVGERKAAEEALRHGEERYRSVIAAMQDGIVLLDADGSIGESNAAAERILGLSAEQLMGRTPHDPRWCAIHEDGSPFPGETHPPMVTLRTGEPCTDVVMGVHKPDGTLTWISVNSQPLLHADGRTLVGVVASFEDVTGRKRTEEALRRATEELVRCGASTH
jgi:PAS domain S-box-containing protein